MQLTKLITLSLQKRRWQVLPVSVALSNTVKHFTSIKFMQIFQVGLSQNQIPAKI